MKIVNKYLVPETVEERYDLIDLYWDEAEPYMREVADGIAVEIGAVECNYGGIRGYVDINRL